MKKGKTIGEAKGEILYAARFISWSAEEAIRSYGVTIPSSTPHTGLKTIREPVRVCGIITPWNFPAVLVTRKIAPALTAGCSVVIKPPSEAPFTYPALTKLTLEAGIPAAVIQVCPTKNREAATELATNPLVNKTSFTGSTNVAKMLAKLSAGTLKKVSLELGGSTPVIVFDDADVDLAVEGAMFCKFRCSGQTCVWYVLVIVFHTTSRPNGLQSANRIYVQKGIASAFTANLVEKVATLKMGGGLNASTTQGRLIHGSAVAKVKEHVADAVGKGAKVETGAKAPDSPGFFFKTTVLSGVTEYAWCVRCDSDSFVSPGNRVPSLVHALCKLKTRTFGLRWLGPWVLIKQGYRHLG